MLVALALAIVSKPLLAVVRTGGVLMHPARPLILGHLSSISFGFNSGAAFSAPNPPAVSIHAHETGEDLSLVMLT